MHSRIDSLGTPRPNGRVQLRKQALAAITLALLVQSVFAQSPPGASANKLSDQAIEEIVVTAQKRNQREQDVPMSVSAIGTAALEKTGAVELTDIAKLVPALQVTTQSTASSSTYVVFMRGVGAIDAEQAPRDLGVGIYLDDVYMGHSQGLAFAMADLDRVEVLRGPQGTLYGRNTIGGAVKFVTAKPIGELGLKQTIDAGNLGRFRSLTSVDLPEVAGVAAKFSYLRTGQDGLVVNPGIGGDFGKRQDEGFRGIFRWTPVASVTVDYAHDNSNQDGTPLYVQRYTGSSIPNGVPVPVNHDPLTVAWRGTDLKLADNWRASGDAITANWDFSPDASLKSITSVRNLKSNRLLDGQNAYGVASLQTGTLDMSERSQELLLSGAQKSARIKYVLGAIYYEGKGLYGTQTLLGPLPVVNGTFRPPTLADLPVAVLSDFKNTSRAIYGQVSWSPPILDDRMTVDLGTRTTHDERINLRTQGGKPYDLQPGVKKYSSSDPSLTVDYAWSENMHTYIRHAKAFRAGGFSVRAPANEAGFGPEHLTQNELGLKSQWWDNKIRLNVAAFNSKYNGIQIDGTDTSRLSHTVNAGNATIKGWESEFVVKPSRGLTITADYAHLEWAPDGPLSFGFPIAGGNTTLVLPQVPKDKGNVSAEYSFLPFSYGVLSARADASFITSVAPGTTSIIPGYQLLDLRLTLSNIGHLPVGKLSASLYIKNVENRRYVIYDTLSGGSFGDPRTYGVNMIYQF